MVANDMLLIHDGLLLYLLVILNDYLGISVTNDHVNIMDSNILK